MKLRASYSRTLAAVLGVLPVFGQTAVLTGKVTETVHGKPLPKVVLQFQHAAARGTTVPEVYATTTDAEGRFRVGNLPEGRYGISFVAPGYGWPAGANGRPEIPQPLTLQPGESREMAFRLTPGGVISGRILDMDGEPVRNTTVRAIPLWGSGPAAGGGGATAQSDDRGEYRLFYLPPGRYSLEATASNNVSGAVSPNEQIRGPRPVEGFLTTYYPNARDQDAAATLEVKPGEESSHVDIRLIPAMLYTIRVVTAGAPTRESFASFSLQSRDSRDRRSFSSTMSADTTEFRGVLPGSYVLTGALRNNGIPTPRAYSRASVEVVDHDVEIGAPPFAPPLELTGSLKLDTDAPPFPLQQVRLSLRRDFPSNILPTPNVVVAADGTFSAHDLPPDQYSLLATVPRGAYLKAVKLGNRELPDLHLDLSGEAAPLSVLLATDGGRIRGVVENASGDAGARVVVTLYPEGSQRDRQDRAKTAGTDREGRYTLQDIAPGEYRLYAWDAADLSAAQDADFRKRYAAQSVSVTIAAGETSAVALKKIVLAP